MVKIQINEETVLRVYAAYEGTTTAMLSGLHDKYRLTLKVGDVAKKFTFHNSMAHLGQPLSEEDLIWAVDCVVSDAYSYLNCRDFYDFVDEFGYDLEFDSASAKRAYNGCRRAYEKLSDLLGGQEGIEALNDAIRNKE